MARKIRRDVAIFAARHSQGFGRKVAAYLRTKLGKVDIRNFSDGEIWVKYGQNIRGRDVYLICSTQPPANFLMELLIMVDAARRASARKITAVISYFGYARQDRKDQPRVSITAKLVANLLTAAGVDRIITMDLHAPQIQGFFDIPVDHLYSSAAFLSFFKKSRIPKLTVVSPDVGGIKMARSFAKRLGADLVLMDKRRAKPNSAEVMNIIGEVKGRNILVVDDMIDTGGTFCATVDALNAAGAANVYGAATHPLFSGEALKKIKACRHLRTLHVTDTIDPRDKINGLGRKIHVLSVAPLFAEAIRRANTNRSISSLFPL